MCHPSWTPVAGMWGWQGNKCYVTLPEVRRAEGLIWAIDGIMFLGSLYQLCDPLTCTDILFCCIPLICCRKWRFGGVGGTSDARVTFLWVEGFVKSSSFSICNQKSYKLLCLRAGKWRPVTRDWGICFKPADVSQYTIWLEESNID